MATLEVGAQTPPAPAAAVPVPAAPAAPAPAAGATSGGPSSLRTTPRPPVDPNSIIVPETIDTNTVLITPSAASTNTAPDQVIPAGEIDFRGVDLNSVFTVYAELVGRTILRPANLAAQNIFLKTQTPLTKREAVQALDAVLGLNGISMINVGDKFVKAVQTATANQEGAPFSRLRAADLPDLGPYVTHVVQLKYAKPTEMVQVLQPFAKMQAAILPIDSSGILVLRDFAENVKRMLEMIKAVDVVLPSEFQEEVIPIKYAIATDIANALNTLSGGGGGSSIGGTSGTRGATGSRSGMGGMGRTGMGGVGGMGGIGGMGGVGGYGGTSGAFGANPMGTTTQGGMQPNNSFSSRLQGIINRAATAGEFQILGYTKILADERTNSLLVFASKEDLKMIKDIISKLDIVLAQVLIDVVILSVQLDDTKSFGVGYLEKQSHGIGNYFSGIGAMNPGNSIPGSAFGSLSSIGTNGSTTGGSSGSLPSGGLSYLGSFGGDLDVTLQALDSNSKSKILQRPRIQTSNAKQASLFVGETVPYPTGSYYGGGAYGGYSSIQQMQIGVSIDVTPLINVDGLVVMDIHNRIDDVEGFVNIANVGNVPTTSSKEAQTSVAVRDHDTIILGGLIQTTLSDTLSGVPFLMDIPVLGQLFRSTSKTKNRTELLVLIRPTVLPTPEVAALTAVAEKHSMPGVRSAEREFQAEESQRLRKEDKADREYQKQEEKRLKEIEKKERQSQGDPKHQDQSSQNKANSSSDGRLFPYDGRNPSPPSSE